MAEPMQYNEAYCRDQLQENDAMFFENMENTGQVLLGDAELNIAWKVSTPDAVPKLRWFLENYTWCKNTAKQRYVENPTVAGNPVLGIWRQTYVRDLRKFEQGVDMYYVILTLRQGFIETLVTDTVLDWSEARIEQNRELPSASPDPASQFVIVKWNNVSPYKLETICNSIEALDSASFSPTIRGEAYGDSFHRLYVSSSVETDGSGTISMLLAKPEYKLSAFHTWATNKQNTVTYLWDVPRDIAQTLINAEKALGKSVTPSYNPTQGLVDLIIYEKIYNASSITNMVLVDLCDYTMYGSMYWGVYNPDLYVCPSYVKGSVYYKDISNNDDGSYDVSIRHRKARYRHYPLMQTLDSLLAERYEQIQMSVTGESVPDISNIPQGFIYRQNRTPNEDCSSNYETSYDKGIYNIINMRTVLASNAFVQYDVDIRNSETAVSSSIIEPCYIYRSSSALNDYGLYDSKMETIQSVPMDIYFTFLTDNGYGNRRVFRNLPAVTVKAYLDAMPINPDVSISINNDATYDGHIQYRPSSSGGSGGGTFVAADCHWVAYAKSEDGTRTHKYCMYRKYYAVRQDAANAMNGQYQNMSGPRYDHGLWEATYSTTDELV